MTPQERKAWVGQMGARTQWWALASEPVIEPSWEIVDAHFHLWDERDFPDPQQSGAFVRTSRYLLDEFHRDTSDGHRIAEAVYVECGSGYRSNGTAHLRAAGETAFAAASARDLASRRNDARIAAIVAHADLREPALAEVLDAHEAAGAGLPRGIRQSGARLDDPSARLLAGAAPPGLYVDPDFRRGLAMVGERGLAFDAFQFHFQLGDLAALAREATGTTIIVDHLGAPIGYAGLPADRDPVFREWARHVEALASLPNIVMKLGGMASIVTGYDGHRRVRPPLSEEFVEERGDYFRHAIACFGPHRCMFESNFPVDSTSISYRSLWNAYKRIAMEHGDAARHALLAGTARRVYRL